MTEYELTQEDIKYLKYNLPRVEYKYHRFDGGWVVKRVETTFVRDNFLEDIKSGKFNKNKESEKIKLE